MDGAPSDKRGLGGMIAPVVQQIDPRRTRILRAWPGPGGVGRLLAKVLTAPSRGRFII